MAPATALCGRAHVMSLDAPASESDDAGDEYTFHDLLATEGEAPDTGAGRHLDWDEVLPDLDDRRRAILEATARGLGPSEIAAEHGVSPPRIVELKRDIGKTIRSCWGTTGIVEAGTPPSWSTGLRAVSERRACRYERAAES